VAVTNEVGSGVVPANPLARRYRDLLGRVNAIWAEAADRVGLVVAGRVLPLSGPEALLGGVDGG
jgi:adenosylcobyric acid synthase